MTNGKMRVAVIFGGKSGEHEVSIASARSVMRAMDPDRYEVLPVGITKGGRWLLTGDPLAALEAGENEEAPPRLAAPAPPTGDAAVPCPEGGRELVPGTAGHRFPEVDIVFPVLHGTYGEDGTVQGLLELAGLPYVGSGVLGSALGLDKVAMKAVLEAHGLPVVEYVATTAGAWRREPGEMIARVEERLPYPVFVKPANLGSSVGVSKAHDRGELRAALDLAARFDRRLLVERGVNAREIECAVLGNDEPIASVLGEVVPSHEFYDYRAKYVDGDSALYIPASLPEETARTIQDLAVRAFRALDCAGLARADFLLCRDTGRVYVNELNTLPGFTEISMYPKLWEASGLPYPRLIDRLIELALERHAERAALERSYGFDH
jgi:D-alanine-D-alanine ligase